VAENLSLVLLRAWSFASTYQLTRPAAALFVKLILLRLTSLALNNPKTVYTNFGSSLRQPGKLGIELLQMFSSMIWPYLIRCSEFNAECE
jgi:hypothetical protein